MRNYIIKRILLAIVTIFVVMTITFFMMHAIPGTPFSTGNDTMSAESLEVLMSRYGLDQPLYKQYVRYVTNILKGDFGVSMSNGYRSVSDIILTAFPVSADLGLRALIFGTIAGILLGIEAALHRGKPVDHLSTIVAIIGISVPSFVLGTVFQTILGLGFSGWFKAAFHTDFQVFPIARWQSFRYTLIPSFVLGMGTVAGLARLMRTSMLDVIGQDYVKTAKSKGISNLAIVWKHEVRNAMMPVVTVLGRMIGGVVTGSYIIESQFAIPGLGKYLVNSITARDYTMTMGLTVFYSIFIVLSMLLVDLMYCVIDPRVRITK
ncbi:MAG: ABC transporter permease [Lachnospiraceae bacterium]|jgi:oligopeptide transport system permease protein|nr:ABC transporter permease [Lachnospiraceae bacterium]MBR3510246.1 ABC transporter permease [Lachnospiraceae bacterium]MBR4605499.1 ABC transporter permease [Lachnospiraceae bacterium]MBR6151608.1 ABC transporter permease [Lachnospiraceae bacterium]